MKNTVLLCSFVRNDAIELAQSISRIKDNFDTGSSPIFVLQDENESDRVILTYNITKEDNLNFKSAIRDTIQVHRKKGTNTLYTLNALNEVVRLENNQLDHNYQVDWNQYQNCLFDSLTLF